MAVQPCIQLRPPRCGRPKHGIPSVGPRAVRRIQALRRLEEEKVAAPLVAADRHKPGHIPDLQRFVHRVHLGGIRFQPDVCGRRDHRDDEQSDPAEQRVGGWCGDDRRAPLTLTL